MILRNNMIMFICFALIMLSGFSTDMYAPSLPAIAAFMEVKSSLARVSLSIFVLGFGIGQLPIGTLSDYFGRRALLLPCLILYIVASWVASQTHHIISFLLCRFIQGVVCAGPSAICKAVLNDVFSGKEHERVFVYLSTCWGAALVIAPVIGGYLDYYLGWQSVFYMLTVIGLVLLLMIYCWLPETRPRAVGKALSIKKLSRDFSNVLLNLKFLSCAVMNSIFYLIILTFSIMGPFLIQSHWHFSEIYYGYMALIVGICWMLGSYISKCLLAYFSGFQLLTAGMVLLGVLGLANLWLAEAYANTIYTLMVPLSVIILVSAVVFPTIMSSAMSIFDRSLGGTASSILGTITFILASICSLFISYVHPNSVRPLAMIILILLMVNWIFTVIYALHRVRR